MEKDTFTDPMGNIGKDKDKQPKINVDVDPQQPMGKGDKNYNDPQQMFPNEVGE